MNDLAEVKPTDDAEIARKAADMKRRHVEDEYGAGFVSREVYNRFLNQALRYLGKPLRDLRLMRGPIATYIVGAREARGEV